MAAIYGWVHYTFCALTITISNVCLDQFQCTKISDFCCTIKTYCFSVGNNNNDKKQRTRIKISPQLDDYPCPCSEMRTPLYTVKRFT